MRQTKEHILKVAKKFKSRKEFKMKATAEYSAALRFNKKESGFMDKVCNHMKSTNEVRKKYLKYSKKILIEEAKKYPTRNEFRINANKEYKALLKLSKEDNTILRKAFSHTESYTKQRSSSFEKVKESSLSYETKTQFRKSNPSLYKKALSISKNNNKLKKELFSHMRCLVVERELDYTKNELVPEIRKILRKNRIKFSIHQEVILNKNARIDLVIEIKGKESIFIPVEVKHDFSDWTNSEINKQLSKYNNHFKRKKNTTKTILISPKGRYGVSSLTFLKELDKSIKNKKIDLSYA